MQKESVTAGKTVRNQDGLAMTSALLKEKPSGFGQKARQCRNRVGI
jgi:hypothetical protein